MRGETKPVQNFPTEKGFSHRIVSRSCRGCWKAARVARKAVLPAGHHLCLAGGIASLNHRK